LTIILFVGFNFPVFGVQTGIGL